MICNKTIKKYCKEDISLIENYEQAITDKDHIWDCHHRLEIGEGYTNSTEDLKLMNLYFNRPANELIFISHEDHTRLHSTVRHIPCSESTKKKIGNANRGKTRTEEQKRNIAKASSGRVMPKSAKDKLSKANGERLAKFGKSCKGKSWKIIDGKRVWYEL